MTQAAIYRRTASDDERAMSRQAERLVAFAARRGVQIIADYADHNVPGNTGDRTALTAMLADAKSGRFIEVLVTSPDRIGRAARVVVGVLDQLHEAGVRVVAESLDCALDPSLFAPASIILPNRSVR